MSNTLCSKCGDCCEEIWVTFHPDRLVDMSEEDKTSETLVFASKYWDYQGHNDFGQYKYSCQKFDSETRLCTAHDERPPVCSNFPYYGRERIDDGRLPERCSFQADLRTNLPIVQVTNGHN